MKIIDLLNKIANGEEVPKHIHIRDVDSYTWQKDVKAYWSDKDENNLLSDLDLSSTDLKEDIEILEEEKKIPEKLEQIMSKRGKYNSIDELAEEVFKSFETIDDLIINQNEIIDYLKSKGDE